jgi:hypothetical protein
MKSILEQINDPQLNKLIGCVSEHWSDRLIPEYFKRKRSKMSNYDPDLLWLLMYKNDYSTNTLDYIDANYTKFRQVLDAGFANKIVLNGRFQAHVWEMILCDVLSSYGKLIPKGEAGADILLQTNTKEIIQIEAVVPNEAADSKLHTVKPVFDKDNFFSHSGNINDMELPIVLRFLQGFDKKSGKIYDRNKPLIIAINTGPVVGLSTMDDFVLRQALFGLGCQTITKHADGSFSNGLQQTPELDKGGGVFPSARFRDPKFRHVSGVIYSSQKPHSLTPHGTGWSNSGLIYVPNPMASCPANIDFDCMERIVVTEDKYEAIKAGKEFTSRVTIRE